jgi:hypothetical protein
MVPLKVTGYGIKFLAPLAQFKWDVVDPGGAGSLLKYRDAIDATNTEDERKAARDWLYSYNVATTQFAIFSQLSWTRDDISEAVLHLGLLKPLIERGSRDTEIESYLTPGNLVQSSDFYYVISKLLRIVLCH